MKLGNWLLLLPLLAGLGCLTLGQPTEPITTSPVESPPPVVTADSIDEDNVHLRIEELKRELEYDQKPPVIKSSNEKQ
jgi:hypothetical protein